MGDPFTGIIGGLASAGTSLFNMWQQGEQNRITREREDNAIQRRAKDMEAAGFNPVLAAGNPAGAQALSLPHAEDPAQAAMAMMKGGQDIATSAAEKVRVEEATKQVKAQTRITKAEADMKEYDRDVQRAQGDPDVPSNVVVTPGGSYDIQPAVRAAKAKLQQQIDEATGVDQRNKLLASQKALADAESGLKGLDLETLKNVGGGAAGNAALQVILTLLRAIK